MTDILITGAHSYIGTAFADFMSQWPQDYRVTMLDLHGEAWQQVDFSAYDTVLHVAGIAHRKETAENAHLYYEVNRDLAAKVAQKAKADGVKQFVFLSSMSVYGLVEGTITAYTPPIPRTHYGKSKLQAENLLAPLNDKDFTVSILRPPMVYGDGCKGNYQSLIKLAKVLPVCPDYQNQRSMVSIDTLCTYVKAVIDRPAGGIYFPQENDYICTCQMMADIAAHSGKKLPLTQLLNPAVSFLKLTRKGRKAFGDLIYRDLDYLPF